MRSAVNLKQPTKAFDVLKSVYLGYTADLSDDKTSVMSVSDITPQNAAQLYKAALAAGAAC